MELLKPKQSRNLDLGKGDFEIWTLLAVPYPYNLILTSDQKSVCFLQWSQGSCRLCNGRAVMVDPRRADDVSPETAGGIFQMAMARRREWRDLG